MLFRNFAGVLCSRVRNSGGVGERCEFAMYIMLYLKTVQARIKITRERE